MRRTLFLIGMAVATLTACNKDDSYSFKKDAVVYLNGVEQPKFKSTATQYSLHEIVSNIYTCLCCTDADGNWERNFSDSQRDTVNNRLMMWATDILDLGGNLNYAFIGTHDVYLKIPTEPRDEWGNPTYQTKWDTCGYIPQSVLNSAREQIEALYAQERYDEIYELFHTAFVFYPCTGQEYKDIVANGGN